MRGASPCDSAESAVHKKCTHGRAQLNNRTRTLHHHKRDKFLATCPQPVYHGLYRSVDASSKDRSDYTGVKSEGPFKDLHYRCSVDGVVDGSMWLSCVSGHGRCHYFSLRASRLQSIKWTVSVNTQMKQTIQMSGLKALSRICTTAATER